MSITIFSLYSFPRLQGVLIKGDHPDFLYLFVPMLWHFFCDNSLNSPDALPPGERYILLVFGFKWIWFIFSWGTFYLPGFFFLYCSRLCEPMCKLLLNLIWLCNICAHIMDAEDTGGLELCIFTWEQIHQSSDLFPDSTAMLWGALPKLIAPLTLQQNVLRCVSGTEALMAAHRGCTTSGSRYFAPS